MGNDTRQIRGMPNSSAPGSGSGLRMSTRSRTLENSSPGGVRKSQRLENRVSGSGRPLRRSERDRKLQSLLSKPGSKKKGNNHGGSRKKGKVEKEVVEVEEDDEFEMGDKTLKEIVEEVRDPSPKIGEKRKKGRKNNGGSSSETNSKKRKLDSCFDNVDSGLGGTLEVVLGNGGENVDSGGLKLDEGLEVKCEEDGSSGCDTDEEVRQNCDEDVDRGILEPGEDPQECCDGEELEKDCRRNTDDCTQGLCLDANSSFCAEKPYEVVDGTLNEKNVVNGLVEEVNGSVVERLPNHEDLEKDCLENTDDCTEGLCSDAKSSFCVEKHSELVDGTQNEKNVVNGLVEEVNGSVTEELPNQDAQSAVGRAADNTNDLRCSEKEPTVGEVDHDSPNQDPCSRVSNSMGSENLIPISKDRGECSNAMDEDSHIANSSNSLFGGNQASIVSCKSAANLLFQEYWVPVEISNVQLEQYCSVMLSNSTVLRLCSKSDSMGSLHEILISILKCCDHPYLGNPSLRNSLLSEQPSLDAALDMGVKASGKLQLLDKILSEFRNQGLKVVILFQSIGGSGKDNLEVVLDDFLTWRFGKDSFEYAASGGQPSKKHAALNKFNRESDVSFLLLETRACHPSVKLSSVDSVIILNSDWNPLNDLRTLQKITIDSILKPIKVFRFYCSCTFEEKALIFAKNDTLPNNIVPINPMNPSTKQALLMWGSSYLFSRLDKFHQEKVLNYRDNVALGSSFVTDVFQEIVSLVKNDGNINSSRYVSEAGLDGRCYLKNIPLFGEQRNHLEEGVSSYTFWTKLLEGKQPQWRFLPGSSERNRKRVAYPDNLSSPPDAKTDEPVKKRKDPSPRKAGQHPEDVKDKSNEHQGLPAHEGRSGLHDQRGLFEMLKPTVSRLCETLMLKDEVKRLAERFLEYVLNNHRVTKEPETILQAFQISVCWTAAEVLEKNIDHRKSLHIAVEKMDFKCLEQEADSVYGKMKLLMKIFLSRNLKILKSSVDPPSATDDGIHDLNKNCESISNGTAKNITKGLENVNKEVCSPSKMTNKEKDSILDLEKVKNHCETKIQKLKERQNVELIKFEKNWHRKRAELEASYRVDSAVISYSYAMSTDVLEKLKILENDYAKKREDLDKLIYNQRKELEARQLEERDEEQKKIAQLLELLKPVVLDGQVLDLSSANSVDSQTAESGGEACGTHSHALSSHNIGNPLNSDDTNQMNTVSMGKKGVAAVDLDNGVSPSFCCTSSEQPTSLVSTFRKHQNADGITCQDIVDGLCQAEEQVLPCTDNCSTSPGGESLLLDQNRCASDGQLHNRPNEGQPAVQNSCTKMQQQIPHREAARSVDANIDQGVSYASVPRGASTAHASHPNEAPVAPTISRIPSSHHYDPLQIEFDRIWKQIGETINAHEEAKIRLKSECEKEIEELVAQIRRKYYVKLEEADSSFTLMKNDLERNQSMVVMNKFLADAFRYKCMDSKAGSTVKGISCSIELPYLLQHVTGTFPASASFSSDPSASSPMSTRPPVQGALPSPLPAFNVPTRSPHMRTSSGGLQQTRHETRAPGPHLQHSSFQSAMPINNKQPSSVLPLQPPKINHLASLSAMQLPATPMTFQNTPGQSHPGSKQSLTDLLMEMGKQNDTIIRRLSENLLDWPSNTQDHESRIFSQFESTALSEIGKTVDPTGDVVCLADDD